MNRILLVDDSADNISAIRFFLGENYKTVAASSGFEAMELLRQNSFDLILSDYQMENGDGIWLLEQLKSLQNAPPCIILTADLTKGADFFLKAGAQGFCPRHRIMDSLLDEVRRFLD